MLLGTQFPIKSSMFKNLFSREVVIKCIWLWWYLFKITCSKRSLRGELIWEIVYLHTREHMFTSVMLLTLSGDITNERGSKSEGSFTCLEECSGFCVSLWYVLEMHGGVRAFWLFQACLPFTCVCYLCLICTLLTWSKTNGPWSLSHSLFDLQQWMPWRKEKLKSRQKDICLHLADCSVSKGCGINPDLSWWSSYESSYPSSMRFDYLRSFYSCSHSCKYNTCCVT